MQKCLQNNWKWQGHQGSHYEALYYTLNSKVLNIQFFFFQISTVLAVSVSLFVRINHESGQTICGLAWNPKGNEELAYTDNQVCFYLTVLNQSEIIA